jgi:uncharacterized protein YfiM (DUF2279 family)
MRAAVLILILSFFGGFVAAQGDTLGADVPRETTGVNHSRLAITIGTEAAFYGGSMAYLQWVWYKDHKRVPFEFYDDSKGYLQVDKFGHAWGSYLESYIGYHALRSCGVSRAKSLLYGGTLGILLQTPIEVWDGLYEGWGFSWSDMAANALGSAIVVGQELLWKDQRIKYKWSYAPSPYADQANGYLGSSFAGRIFNDYNGHTYWLSMSLNHLGIGIAPPWLCISAGYSANGMFGEFENIKRYRGVDIPETARYRQYLLSLDVDWTKIKTNSRVLKTLFQGMFTIKFPFPALEINTLGKIRGYGLYY